MYRNEKQTSVKHWYFTENVFDTNSFPIGSPRANGTGAEDPGGESGGRGVSEDDQLEGKTPDSRRAGGVVQPDCRPQRGSGAGRMLGGSGAGREPEGPGRGVGG